jgi:hypothetical protein|tara:strand:+ start:1400 stop:2812 length:1413 start_codon:yes stop_codon:yes gene_type:complete
MTISILLDIPESFAKQARYTVENIFSPYNEDFVVTDKFENCNNENNRIVYCMESSPYLHDPNLEKDLFVILENSSIEFFSHFKPYDLNDLSYIEKIPCIFPLKNNEILKSNRNLLPFDIIAASFFFLSCWQEYSIGNRDKKGRVPLKSTIQYKLNIIRKPIVNEYLRILGDYINKLWGTELEHKEMPGEAVSYVSLSHDICWIDISLKKYIKLVVNNRHVIVKNFSNFLSAVRYLWSRTRIYKKVYDIEEKLGVFSTIFLLTEYPAKYKYFVDSLIKTYYGTNFELAHHLSGMSIMNQNVKQEKAMIKHLDSSICGERVHTLRFDINSLFSQVEMNAYNYDNSLLFPEDMGYRTGFSYPHYIFDPIKKKPFKVLAIPLNIMDTTLVDRKYLWLKDESVEKELLDFISNSLNYGGVLSVLIHYSFFLINTKSRLEMYERILTSLISKGVKIGTCREIYTWRDKSKNILFLK